MEILIIGARGPLSAGDCSECILVDIIFSHFDWPDVNVEMF